MRFTNHLADQTSPYLLQHAHNPVDWYPWGEEALNKAAAENKPILLSVGYSACHWCHVMAHESFEDEETAQLMNQQFINIKVDREERPDIDQIYQTAHQLLTQNPGGWPLTIILDPKHHLPFFTGTYFPKEPRYQLPAFKGLLQQAAQFYEKNQQRLQAQAPLLTATLQQLMATALPTEQILDLMPYQKAIQQLTAEYDELHGGFGNNPKFPRPINFELLFREATLERRGTMANKPSLIMLQNTLTKMALGGIYDQIGGGFYRYTVDAKWEIPHFEKMLYDNAQLLYQYVQVNAVSPSPLFTKVIEETANWVMQHMQSTEGGYFSALDADSESKEGEYYLWTPQQIKSLLSQEEYELLTLYFNLAEPANFAGKWHLHVINTAESLIQHFHLLPDQLSERIRVAREKLLAVRMQRPVPGLDDKILTSWNALMIKAMALAGSRLAQPAWLDSAERALRFIHQNLWINHRLLATYRNQRARLPAYLDDYAFLLDAIIIFLQCRWSTEYLLFAQELAEIILQHFQDTEQGNFFFVADDHEALLYRPKILTDNVTPAGSGVACYALQRLGYLLNEPRYLAVAEQSLKSAWSTIKNHPAAHISLLLTLQEYMNPPQITIIRGEGESLEPWQIILQSHYDPGCMTFTIGNKEVTLPTAIAQKTPTAGTVAYVCRGQQCTAPVHTPAELNSIFHQKQ